MSKETSTRVAKIAGRILREVKAKNREIICTSAELKSLAASALAQKETEKLLPPNWKELTAMQKAFFKSSLTLNLKPAEVYTLAITLTDPEYYKI